MRSKPTHGNARARSAFVLGAGAAAIVLAAMPAEVRCAEPSPSRVTVRKVRDWEPCVLGATGSSAKEKCPTLVVDFRAALPPAQEAAVTGAASVKDNVWRVRSIDISTHDVVDLGVADVRTRLGLTGLVFLVLDRSVEPAAVDATTHLITVTYVGPPQPAVLGTVAAEASEDAGVLVDAFDPEDADVMFSGRVKAADGAAPLFSVEARLRKEWYVGRNEWGGIVEVTAEEQGNVDPDSIVVGVSYGRVVRALRSKLLARPFSGEFSRDDPRTKGYVSSAELLWNAIPSLKRTITVNVLAGGAIGSNLANARSDDGSGLIARGKAGVEAWTRWTRQTGLKRVTLSGTWAVLALARSEIDPERLDAAGVPTLTRRPRHRLTADLDVGITSRFGISVQYRQGPLPPSFETVNASVALGLAYKADFR